ncbi:MAG: DNA mismatch repair endonuclease MutL [Clostridiales bacterium]|nr:DNA mismatch repair endonuclease MutL [Clostridiales bacterium]
MGRINVLDRETCNAIKAGEVIERPVSVVKELVDNSVDSGATHIKIEFTGGGISLIRVTDDGCGMDREDAQKAFLIHATSKLKRIEDIYNLSTMGFRGEALASIAACSDVTLRTATEGGTGTEVIYKDGALVSVNETSDNRGTSVTVENLFKSFPARYKFLKRDATEGMYITSLVEKLAVINPAVSIKLIKDNVLLFTTPGSGSMLDAIYAVYGKETANSMLEVTGSINGYRIEGFTGKTSFTRGNRGLQCIYVNDRLIHSKTVTAAIDEAYKNAVMKNKYPVCFLKIYCPEGTVDVNVHPQKAEVKFADEREIFSLVFRGVRDAVFGNGAAGDDFLGNEEDSSAREPASSGVQLRMDFARTESSATPEATRQQSHTFSREPSRTPAGDPAAANRLLEVLSGFKPDISELGGTSSEAQPDTEQMPVFEQEATIADDDAIAAKTDIDLLAGAEFIGILFTTYIIMQSESDVFFVDQHAAHERVMYEKFMAKKAPGKRVEDRETLLVPQIIAVSAADYGFISDNLDRFDENGFEIELLGDREIALRSMPLGSGNKPSVMFEQIMTDLKRDVPAGSDIWYSLIQTTACKAAIKAGDVISREEAISLVMQMTGLEDPYHCAHGRPTFFKISRKDFEKNFRRIV